MSELSSTVAQSTKRLAFIDLAKCIALALIIVAHTQWEERVNFAENFRLAIFWICAGYTSKPDFSLRRKTKLLVSYAFMSVICLLYTWLYEHQPPTGTDIYGIFYARFCILQPPLSPENPPLLVLFNSVLWFLPALFTSYCVFKMIMMAKSLRCRLMLVLCSLAVGSLLTLQPYLLPWSADSAFVFAVFMCIGHWLRQYRVLQRIGWIGMIVCLAVYIVSQHFVGEINLSLRMFGNYWPLLLISATSGSMLLLGICRWLDDTWPARLAVAVNSESLYIFGLQLIFIRLTDEWLADYLPDWRIRVLTYIVVCFTCGYAIGRLLKLITRK